MEETEYEKGKMKYNIGLSQPPEKIHIEQYKKLIRQLCVHINNIKYAFK